jgi:hypothetical protein
VVIIFQPFYASGFQLLIDLSCSCPKRKKCFLGVVFKWLCTYSTSLAPIWIANLQSLVAELHSELDLARPAAGQTESVTILGLGTAAGELKRSGIGFPN